MKNFVEWGSRVAYSCLVIYSTYVSDQGRFRRVYRTHKDGEGGIPATFHLCARLPSSAVLFLQTRMPDDVNHTCWDAIVSFALDNRDLRIVAEVNNVRGLTPAALLNH